MNSFYRNRIFRKVIKYKIQILKTSCAAMFVVSCSILLSVLIHSGNGDELVSAVIVFRHGARTPLEFHPNDPYRNISYWTAPPGELTEIGGEQAYELGKWVRDRYNNILPKKYSSKDFFILSSGLDRCLMSAAAFSAGLYPSTTTLPVQPIPIHSMLLENDHMICLTGKHCPKYDRLVKKLLRSSFFTNMDKENEKLYTYISKYTGLNITSIKGLEKLYDTFYVEEYYNYTLPNWVKEIYPQKLHKIAFLNLLFTSYTTQIARLLQGPLVKEIVSYFHTFTNDTSKRVKPDVMTQTTVGRKLFAISGHDTNVVGLLRVLKAPNLSWTHFNSALIFELKRKDSKDLYLNIFYKNGTEIKNVKVGEHDLNCDFGKFLEYMRPFMISKSEWDRECNS